MPASSELLSLRLYVLQAAISGLADRQPPDVFLRIHPAASDDPEECGLWVDGLGEMYSAWARRRGMRVQRLVPEEHLYAISGLGAGTILAGEAGIHVLELPVEDREDGRAERLHAVVEVAPWLPTLDRERPLTDEARAALDAMPTRAEVVRRYREKPAPLVRDAVRGYRTGRLDRVLAGDFDLF